MKKIGLILALLAIATVSCEKLDIRPNYEKGLKSGLDKDEDDSAGNDESIVDPNNDEDEDVIEVIVDPNNDEDEIKDETNTSGNNGFSRPGFH